MEEKRISIGAIAKSYGVSENCIRRMESAGLITPVYVSKKSGYRYYNSSDIVQISTVLTLRSFGFTNKDIRLFMQNPADLSVLYHKLQDMHQTITILLQQLDRRLKTEESYKCNIFSFNEAFCYTKEFQMIPHLATFSRIASEIQFEAIWNKLPVDYTHPLVIETSSTDYRTFDPGREQKIRFHIPLRQPLKGSDITFLPQVRAVDVKWSYPGTDYFKIIPVIDQFFDLFVLKQAGTLRATFDMGDHSLKNAGISNTVMHILIPIE